MPKKKKKEIENVDDLHEGRPGALTLGDFLVPQNLPSKMNAAVTSSASKAEDIQNKDKDISEQNREQQNVFVCRTKKGGLPVKVENRSSGKKVTIIEHVIGDSKIILQEMKNKFGTGGVNQGDFIELQGDCKTKVTKYLNDNKHLLKPYGTKL